jgi:hypothetical protein
MFKKIAIGLAVLVVIVAMGGYYGWSHLDRIVRAAVEKYGTAATQTEVSLSTVNLSLTSGQGSLGGLNVGNPKGFSSNKAMSLGSIAVKIDLGSIRGSGPIVISQIIIDKPQVTYELANNGDSNLQTIQRNAQAYAASAAGGGSGNAGTGASAGAGGSGTPSRKLIINDLQVNDGQVAISAAALNGKQLSVPLPNIHLTGIGKGSGGVTAAQVAQQLLSSISTEAAKAGVTELAKEKVEGALKALPVGAIGGAAADTVGDQLKGVFGQ